MLKVSVPCLFQGADPVSEVVHGPLSRARAPGPHPGGHESRYPLGAAACSSGTTEGRAGRAGNGIKGSVALASCNCLTRFLHV